ncbi:MAG: hypothetical protein ABII06_05855 [Pseudomonadota bacterium]
MPMDIRDKPRLQHEDILGLNFIRSPGKVIYRRHYRFGLRSHIMEVLGRDEIEKENKGVISEGLRCFPKARPIKMLRIFRTRFKGIQEAEEELKRVKVVEAFLAPSHLARSNEFLVDYNLAGQREILLCGLQEYIEGETLDPWGYLDLDHLAALLFPLAAGETGASTMTIDGWTRNARRKAKNLIGRLRKMILETRHVPDLAGVGNLLLTPSGDIKLVDINNISGVFFDSLIRLDDRGYPVCDKSIEALYLLEKALVHAPDLENDPIYRFFLSPQRMKNVKAVEWEFHFSPQKPLEQKNAV